MNYNLLLNNSIGKMSKQGPIFMSKLSQQANLKLSKSNSQNMFHPIHSYIVRKLKQKEKSNDLISKEIDEYMNLPDKFFSPLSPVTIGKKIKLIDMKKIGIEPAVQKKLAGSNKRMSMYRKSLNFNNNNLDSLSRNSVAGNYLAYKDKQQANSEKYEIIDNEQLKRIFNGFKTNKIPVNVNKRNFIKKNESNQIKSVLNQNHKIKKKYLKRKDIPLDIAKSLTYQNNKLRIRQNLDNTIKNISKHISELLNKNENELLINRIDDYCFKKELLKEIDYNKPLDEKYGIYKWNISLRRPNNFEGVRNSYINLTREKNPFWGIIIERYPKIKELKIRPGTLMKNKKYFEKLQKAHFPYINNRDYKNLENLDSIKIQGENLYNIEYNREINNNKTKKLLHKTFVDSNGKIFLKTEINNIFGEKTFCENYHSNHSNFLTTKRTNFTNSTAYNTFGSKFPSQIKNPSQNEINIKEFPSSFKEENLQKKTFFKSKSSGNI